MSEALLLRRRAMMAAKKTEPPVLNPSVGLTLNRILNSNNTVNGIEHTGGAITDYLPCEANNSIIYYNPLAPVEIQTANGLMGHIIVYDSQKRSCDWWNCRVNGTTGSFTASRFTGNGYVRINVIMDGLADSYCYNATTGVVYYAGKNTPYYGKTNIND